VSEFLFDLIQNRVSAHSDSPRHGETGDGGDGMEVQSGDVLSVEGHRELSATTYSERTATGELEYGVDENEWLAVLEREFGITPDGPW
jgi:hypothetical protein